MLGEGLGLGGIFRGLKCAVNSCDAASEGGDALFGLCDLSCGLSDLSGNCGGLGSENFELVLNLSDNMGNGFDFLGQSFVI